MQFQIYLFSDRSGLKEPEAVERLQDEILGAFKRYIAEKRPHQPVHWAKILMKVTDLRTISTRHAERVLCIRLDHSGDVPSHLLNLFNGSDGQDFLWIIKHTTFASAHRESHAVLC